MSYSSTEGVKDYVQVGPNDLGLSDSTDSDGDGTSDWEEFLQTLQEMAKDRIDQFCQRDFDHHQGETVILDGKGKTVLRLPHPVLSVSSVQESQTTLDEHDPVTGSTGEFQWTEAGTLIRKGGTWPDGYQNVKAVLDYGYTSPPGGVVEAEKRLVDHTLVGMSQKRQAPVVQDGDFSVSANIPMAMNKEIREMLSSYKPAGVSV